MALDSRTPDGDDGHMQLVSPRRQRLQEIPRSLHLEHPRTQDRTRSRDDIGQETQDKAILMQGILPHGPRRQSRGHEAEPPEAQTLPVRRGRESLRVRSQPAHIRRRERTR